MTRDKKFISRIEKITGRENVNYAPEDLSCYAYDASGISATPDLVVHPASTAEVAAIVVVAGEVGVPVIPRGAGTGLSGGSVAARGGLVLHFDRMHNISRLDPRNQLLATQPGAINREIKKAADQANLFYPPDPSSTRICTIGGNVAENAGGPYATKYGVTGDYVMGLEIVLASGQIVRTGGEARRNVTGYDLNQLLVGSEGTLAIITEITLRLIPKPETRSTALVAFDDLRAAGEAVLAISMAGLTPAAIELMDRTAIDSAGQDFPGSGTKAAAVLLVEVDGDPASVEHQIRQALKSCESSGGRLIQSASSEAQSEALWETRRSIAPALIRQSPSKIGEDISVPVGNIPRMLERIQEISASHGLKIAVFGHAGDGNLHPNILTDKDDPEMMLRTEAAIEELFAAALDLGGTLSGEHGIGMAKVGYVRKALSEGQLSLMQGIKQVFDPQGILNPGKIFPR